MTDFALTAAQIAAVRPEEAEIVQKTAAETITAGQSLFQDTNGKVQLADANAAGERQTRYLALAGGAAGQTIACLRRGAVFGFTITQAYDSTVYQSDTTGVLGDSAGTVTVPVGLIEGIDQGGTVTKVIFFNPRYRADFT